MNDAMDFFEACRRNDVAAVQKCYDDNPSLISVSDSRGFTALILAVYNEAPDVVDFLLEKGADVHAQDASGNTALMGVCFKGYKEIAQKLLNAGVDVNQRNANGATALTFAATFGHLQIAEWLLQKGADVKIKDSRGKSPLDHAYIQENDPMISLLEKYCRK